MHWNIQISIQRVEERDNSAPALRGLAPKEKRVTQVLDLKITADSEAEAYKRAYRMLNASAPVSLPESPGMAPRPVIETRS